MHNLHPGANLHPLCRVHMPMNYVHTHQDLIRNLTQGTHFMRYSLCFNVLNSVLYRYMCVRGRGRGFLEISTAECVVETFLHFFHLKAKSEKHIHNNDVLFL